MIGASDEQTGSTCQHVQTDLYTIQAHLNKLEATASAYRREQDIYNDKRTELLQNIETATEDIQQCKKELEKARIEMQQQKACEEIKNKIVSVAARSKTVKEIEAVRDEIEDLEDQRTLLRMATERRKSHFNSILHLIRQIEDQITMEKQVENETENADKTDAMAVD